MYLFCISCKWIVATIKVPTLVRTLDSGFLGWLSVAIHSDPDVSEACDTLHWCVTFLRNSRNYCPVTMRHIPHDQNAYYSPVKTWEFAHAILYSGVSIAGSYMWCEGTRGGAVGWGTVLQVGRSRFRFPMVSLEFFINIILPAALLPLGGLSF